MIVNKHREQFRQELLAELNSAKTQTDRNRHGQFATPFKLASEIVHHAVCMLPEDVEIRFLEPGFGTGPFYSALINSVFAGRVRAACGFELDPHYGQAAQRLCSGNGLRLNIGDFTKTEPPKTQKGKFNLVVCNPPYVRHHHLSPTQKKDLQSAVAFYTNFKMHGLSGLYTYFMILSQAWMSEGGVGAWLIPSEFMDVNYGQKVKQFLLKKVTLHQVHHCNPQEVQFDDALVSSAIVFFTNCPPSKNHKVVFSFGGSLRKPRLSHFVDTEYLRDIPKWRTLPQNGLASPSHNSDVTLANLFTIKRGVATGCNSFFILTPDCVQEHQISTDFLIPILPSPKHLETNEVISNQNGTPKTKNGLFLLSCNVPQEKLRSMHPSLWRYLQHGVAAGVHERYLCRHRSPWYAQEVRPPAPLLFTYMGRPTKHRELPFRFILNHSKATAANVYLLLYPKPPLASLFRNEPRMLKEVWKALSSIPPEMLTGKGRLYGGGLHKMEPRELGNVPANTIGDLLSGKIEFVIEKQLTFF